MNKALLIIDMQKGSFTPETPRYDTKGVVKRINETADLFRNNGETVILIQHDGSKENIFLPNTEEWQILEDLIINESDFTISKTANDAFYQSELQDKLKELDIEEVVISGCATDFCVESTIQSAITKNYHVTILSDCHTTGNRPHLHAKGVIDHYNWIWQNMIPAEGEVKVINAETFKKEAMLV